MCLGGTYYRKSCNRIHDSVFGDGLSNNFRVARKIITIDQKKRRYEYSAAASTLVVYMAFIVQYRMVIGQ